MTYFSRSNKYYQGRLVGEEPALIQDSSIAVSGTPQEGDVVTYSEFRKEYIPVQPDTSSAATGLLPIPDSTLLGRKIGSGAGDPEPVTADEASQILDLAADPFLRESRFDPVEMPTWVGPFSRSLTAVALIPGTELSITPGWWVVDYTGILDTSIQTNGGNWQINFSAGSAHIVYFSGLISMMANVGDGNSTPLRNVGQSILVSSTRFLTDNRFSVKILLKADLAGDVDLRMGSETAGQTITITALQGVAIRQSF